MTETPTDRKLSERFSKASTQIETSDNYCWLHFRIRDDLYSEVLAALREKEARAETDPVIERAVARFKDNLVTNINCAAESHPSAIREVVEGEREGKPVPGEAIPVPQPATVPCLWDDQSRQFVAVYSIRGVEIAAAIRARERRRGMGETDELLLAIISRSIGRTIHTENFTQRAQDVLDSIRSGNLEVPQPSTVARDATIATLTAALEEARGALEGVIKEADRDTVGFRRARIALATTNAALGRVEG